jgi:hypothetical protein
MPVMTIGGKTGKNATRGSIEVRINENCQAVVNSIKFDRNGPPVNDDHGGGNRVVPQPKKQLPEKGFRQSINSNGTAEASHLVTHHFKGWARSEMMDCCGIWLTRTHAEMQYYDDFHQV